ncbi:DUF2169 family type VI secretion system accessory protein [Paraburkholderia susongensis]|uniref:Uncharacterized protein YjbI, contains pentapeptide repeats n=1 Tax=Paraburkholderia susongensis TaxID=1515439 RepID=A0A1X7M6T5_9BURK|nr:DUF2169 domain-containing protein [Paraburkholderia susongensis]SMG61223.1 Uncharacterized protein YjbI, contains pentapeptide repeats [Paraburkholderia susongensis]
MRHIKPQAALVATARSQIGQRPMLGISIGIGFRLRDPFVLVHEAAVWEAIKVAAPSMPLVESALPKPHAEWLLAGETTHRIANSDRGGHIDWTATVELGGIRKVISCQAQLASRPAHTDIARLAIDHRHAVAGRRQENPLSEVSGVPPIQVVEVFGARPAPLASMGAIGSDWPQRKQWIPRGQDSLEGIARDGTHMGWPADIDRRFFQQAASDQWSHGDRWPPGAYFELDKFGSDGRGYTGNLPELTAIALVSRTGKPDVERLMLRQQTVWLLPDADIGVMWWNGSVALDYPLDDSPAMLIAAFRDETEPVDVAAIGSFARRRSDLTDPDPTTLADHALMPTIAKGWVWEMILDTDDHPRVGPARRSHHEIAVRLEENRQSLVQARDAQRRLRAFCESDRDISVPAVPFQGDENWRERLQQASTTELSGVVIRDADLSALRFEEWKFDEVRFERCTLDRSEWLNCHFRNVHIVDCSCVDTIVRKSVWRGGGIHQSNLKCSIWLELEIERANIEACRLDNLEVSGGSWSMLSVQGRGGVRGKVKDLAWQAVTWCNVDLSDWVWTGVHAVNLGIIECRMVGITISQCTMLKPSVVLTDLSASVWQRNIMTTAVLSQSTSIKRARLIDCVFKSSSLQDLLADGIEVKHCTFTQLNAQRLRALRSNWSHVVLDGANMTHACFKGASFDRSSLKDAMLYGADMRQSRMNDCNLIRAHTAWMLPPQSMAWRGPLIAAQLAVPEREA